MQENTRIELQNSQTVSSLKLTELYKYLGMLEADIIKQDQMKEQVKKEYIRRVKKVLCSYLDAGNTIQAINVWTVSAFRYSA